MIRRCATTRADDRDDREGAYISGQWRILAHRRPTVDPCMRLFQAEEATSARHSMRFPRNVLVWNASKHLQNANCRKAVVSQFE